MPAVQNYMCHYFCYFIPIFLSALLRRCSWCCCCSFQTNENTLKLNRPIKVCIIIFRFARSLLMTTQNAKWKILKDLGIKMIAINTKHIFIYDHLFTFAQCTCNNNEKRRKIFRSRNDWPARLEYVNVREHTLNSLTDTHTHNCTAIQHTNSTISIIISATSIFRLQAQWPTDRYNWFFFIIQSISVIATYRIHFLI